MSLGPHTITLLLDPPVITADRYGNEGNDWASATRDPVEGCSVQPAGSDEYVVDREAVTIRYRAFLPVVRTIDSSRARAEWKGDQYEIDGVEVWDFDPLGHTDILMRKVTG